MPRLWYMTGVLALVTIMGAGPARADDWDLNLARLCMLKLGNGQTMDCGGGYDTSKGTPSVVADNAAFRALMSELGVIFAPNILNPSDTHGIAGFSFNVELGWTGINPKNRSKDPDIAEFDKHANGEYYYWRAAKSVSHQTFQTGHVRDDEANNSRLRRELPAGFAPHVTVMARKGFWFPVPSFEMGVGARYLIGSRMWAPMATVKVALHEGFQGWPLPAFAVRGSGSRLMGTPGFNLTVAGLDFSVSKHLGIASTFNLTPYAGYQLLWIIADSEVLDATPGIDAMGQTTAVHKDNPAKWHSCNTSDCWTGNFAFDDQSNITRHRFFLGLRANFYIATLMLEYTYFAGGGTSDTIYRQSGASAIKELEIADAAGSQHTFSFSIGLDY